MNRRTFFKGLAGLLALSFLPKVEAISKQNWTHSVYPLEVVLTDEMIEDYCAMGLPPIKSEGRSFCYDKRQPTKLLVRPEWEEDALEILRTT